VNIVDTNVVSELMRPVPSLALATWVRSHGATELYTTSITLAEIVYGIERLRHGRRKDLLRTAANDVFSAFAEHVLAFDMPAAAECARIVTHRKHAGLPIDSFDAQIAAVCRMHDAALATRNVKDFHDTGIHVVDPWHADS
jgi:predicted nucleic acid-binding protein